LYFSKKKHFLILLSIQLASGIVADIKYILDGFQNDARSRSSKTFWAMIENAMVDTKKQSKEEPKRLLRLS
jgi:hypothetical protein